MMMRGRDKEVRKKCFVKPTLALHQLFHGYSNLQINPAFFYQIRLPFVKPTLALHQLFYDDER